VKDKDVLDCGCAEHYVYEDQESWGYLWIHDKICKEAKYCLGIDIEKEALLRLKEMGYNVKYANVETMELGRKFDVIVAGELIEHLSNPGLFLERANKHLRKDGRLIISTPNAFSSGNVFRSLLGRKMIINPQHVCYYDEQTLTQLLKRYGFEVEDVIWHVRPEANRLNFVIKYRKNMAPTMIVIARKVKEPEDKDFLVGKEEISKRLKERG
jgi:SAM-dependent methyltransferase